MRLFNIILTLLSCMVTGCGFHGKLTMPNGSITKWESNRPCVIENKEFKVDGKSHPLLNLKMPDIVGGKVGG